MITSKAYRLKVTALFLLLLVVAVCSLLFGSVNLSFPRLMKAVAGTDEQAEVILFRLRCPRLLAAVFAGIGLSVSGMLLQTVTDNALCAPSVIGVNAGAGLFVILSLSQFPSLWQLLPAAAFFGAILTTFAVLTLSRAGNGFEDKTTLVLSGIAVSALLNAGISFVSMKDPDVLPSYMGFSLGGFSGVCLNRLMIPCTVICFCLILAMLLATKIRLLCLGDEAASSLGVNVRTVRTVSILLCSALCASVVSFAGLLGFVGLIVPHIVRKICKGNMREQLVLCALCGSVVSALSDLLGRTLFAPWELPAGLVMAFVGAPFFIYLLVKRRKTND